jgi:hypothetical protein
MVEDCPELEGFLLVVYPFQGQDIVYPFPSSMDGLIQYSDFDRDIGPDKYYYAISGEMIIKEYVAPTFQNNGWKTGRFKANFSFTMVDTVNIDTVEITDGYIEDYVNAI